eukprot:403337000
MNEMDESERIYMAPEILNNEDTSKLIMPEKIDVFALGVLLFISEFKQPPFRQASTRDPLYRYLASQNGSQQQNFFKYHPHLKGKAVDYQLKTLLCQMLSYDPDSRPSMREILQHSYFSTLE